MKSGHGPAPDSQSLWIEDFPQPATARTLSPNGRAHWAVKSKARDVVAAAVKLAAVRAGWVAVDGPVRVTFRYVRPTRGRIDLDNLSTGVSKAALDSLVRGGYLEDDDSSHVVAVTAEAVYERGRRALQIVVEAV